MVTGLSALKNHQLSMRENTSNLRTIPVSFAKIHQQTQKLKSFPSVFRFRVNSTMSFRLCHTDTMIMYSFPIFIHVMDLKMVTQSSRSGVTTFWILVTISDATSVLGVRKPISSPTPSCGADLLILMLSVKLSHFQYL
jgi:hypothetical protein